MGAIKSWGRIFRRLEEALTNLVFLIMKDLCHLSGRLVVVSERKQYFPGVLHTVDALSGAVWWEPCISGDFGQKMGTTIYTLCCCEIKSDKSKGLVHVI